MTNPLRLLRAFLLASPLFTPFSGYGQVGETEVAQLVQEHFLTPSVYPQERGEVQITALPFVEWSGGAHAVLPIGVEYGLTDRWQLELEWNAIERLAPDGAPPTRGVGDLELETQYSFLAIGGSPFHAAIAFGVTLPTGDIDRGTSEGLVEYEPSLAIAKDVHGDVSMQLFGGLGLGIVQRIEEPSDPVDREPAAHELSVGAGLVVGVGAARLSVEVNWSTNRWNNDGEESGMQLTPGLVWDLPGTWEVGAATSLGLASDAPDLRFAVILLYEFELRD